MDKKKIKEDLIPVIGGLNIVLAIPVLILSVWVGDIVLFKILVTQAIFHLLLLSIKKILE